jgi:hypothetical protein
MGESASRVRRAGVIASLSVVSLLHACGSDSTTTAGGVASDADSFIRNYCDTLSACCPSGKTFDSTRCDSSYRAEAEGNLFDAERAATCLDGLRTAKTKGTLCDWRSEVREPCLLVFTGKKLPGETCSITVPSECAPSPEGDVTCFQSSAEKICELRMDGNSGDSPCITTEEGTSGYASPWDGAPPARGYICQTKKGLYCDPATKACAKAPDIGAACDGSIGGHSCGDAGYCDPTTTTCVARPVAGADCGSGGVICTIGTYCDAMTSRCTMTLADGAPCTGSEICADNSCIQNVCGGDNTAFFNLYCK